MQVVGSKLCKRAGKGCMAAAPPFALTEIASPTCFFARIASGNWILSMLCVTIILAYMHLYGWPPALGTVFLSRRNSFLPPLVGLGCSSTMIMPFHCSVKWIRTGLEAGTGELDNWADWANWAEVADVEPGNASLNWASVHLEGLGHCL